MVLHVPMSHGDFKAWLDGYIRDNITDQRKRFSPQGTDLKARVQKVDGRKNDLVALLPLLPQDHQSYHAPWVYIMYVETYIPQCYRGEQGELVYTGKSVDHGPGITFRMWPLAGGHNTRIEIECHDPAFEPVKAAIEAEWQPVPAPLPQAVPPGAVEPSQVADNPQQAAQEPWDVIPNAEHRDMVRLWHQGWTKTEIAAKFNISTRHAGEPTRYMENLFYKLRKKHGEAGVPKKEAVRKALQTNR